MLIFWWLLGQLSLFFGERKQTPSRQLGSYNMEEQEHFVLSGILLSLTEIRQCLQKLRGDTEIDLIPCICPHKSDVVALQARSDVLL